MPIRFRQLTSEKSKASQKSPTWIPQREVIYTLLMLRLLSLFITVALTAAFSPLQPVFQTFVSGALIGTPVLLFGLDPCKPNAKNCVFKTWTPPPGTSKSKAVKDLRSVIQSYPQQGQAVSFVCAMKQCPLENVILRKVHMDRTLTAVDGLLPSINLTGQEQQEWNIDLPERIFCQGFQWRQAICRRFEY
jgi:hypothetical protein